MNGIRFRAWHKKEKLMCEVVKINFAVGYVVLASTDVGSEKKAYLDDVELMQYTGLNDKNNVEICVGDIVAHGLCKYEIKFEAGFVMRDLSKLNPDYALCAAWQEVATDSFEVVGNLWENTEL